MDSVCKEAVFKKLYDMHAKNLYDFLYYTFGSELDHEDTVQEAFVELWKNCKNVSYAKAKSYLFTIVANRTRNLVKHQKVVLAYQQKPTKTETHITPEFQMEEQQYLEKFQYALSRLTEGQRTAFMLNRVEGKRHKEIAELLGISRKAVEKRIYSALAILQEILTELKTK